MNPADQPGPKPDGQAEAGLREKVIEVLDEYRSNGEFHEYTRLERERWADELTALFQADKAAAVADGRRIQAEATWDKWQQMMDQGDFTNFLDGQVEVWRYETRLQPPTAGEGESGETG